jgi:hypothetical protein
MESRLARITFASLGLMAGIAQARVVTTSSQQSFTATVFNSATSELVDLAGNVHILAKVTPDPTCFPPVPCVVPINIHTNLDGVTGIGQMTGRRYLVNGEFEFDTMNIIPGQTIDIMSFSWGTENSSVNPGHSKGDQEGKVSLNLITVYDATGLMVSAEVFGQCVIQVCLTADNAPNREAQPVMQARGRRQGRRRDRV